MCINYNKSKATLAIPFSENALKRRQLTSRTSFKSELHISNKKFQNALLSYSNHFPFEPTPRAHTPSRWWMYVNDIHLYFGDWIRVCTLKKKKIVKTWYNVIIVFVSQISNTITQNNFRPATYDTFSFPTNLFSFSRSYFDFTEIV